MEKGLKKCSDGGVQDGYLRKKCFFSHMETHNKAEHVNMQIPEYFILDDEEIDKASKQSWVISLKVIKL